MRNHWLISIGLCALTGTAVADDSVLDFVAPRADQQGQYDISVGAIMSGGQGTLAPVGGWFDEDWAYRFGLTVDNPNGGALTEWPLSLDIDARDSAAGYDVFELARANGGDLRVVQGGQALTRTALGHWQVDDNRGRIWFQVADVPAGQSTMALYFGNGSAPLIDDPDAVFRYTMPYASRYALDAAGVPMAVVSSVAGNNYAIGGLTGTLNAGDALQVDGAGWQTGASIASTGPMEVAFSVDTASEGAPVAFARTVHTVVVNRGLDNTFTLLAPFENTSVDVAINGTDVSTIALTQATTDTFVQDLATDDVVQFTAGSPILVAHRSVDNSDGYVLPPPAAEVWGFRSGTARVLAVDAQTDVTVYDSTGATGMHTVAQGQFTALSAGGSGTGDALRLVARDSATGSPARVTVVATADGDGGDAIVFHPASELGRRWVVPTDGRFVLIATTRPSTTCVLTPPDGSPDITVMSAADVPPPWPGRIKFGADTGTNVLAGAVIACDGHGFAYYEDAATDDERNLYPMEAHRKALATSPSVSFGASLMTRYLAGTVALIDTPDIVVPTSVQAWTDFRVAATEPAGSQVSFQLSIDGGQRWLVPGGASWGDAPSPDVGASAVAIRDALPTLDGATGRLRVRVILLSDDGVSRPSVDAIRVFYTAGNPASHLGWDDVADAVGSSVGFPVGISVLNPDGVTITGYTGEATLTASHGGSVTPSRVLFENGRAVFQVAVGGTADDVTLRAETADGLSGFSAPFDLVASEGYALEAVSGDNQFGYIGGELLEPLVVRVLGPGGGAAADVQVTFAVEQGGGALQPGALSSYSALTDAQGLAEVRLRLGDEQGANQVRVEAAGATLDLFARADVPGVEPPTTEGGCCDSGAPTPSPGTLLLTVFMAIVLCPRRLSRA